MQADKTTLNDLSIFNSEEELSVFHHLNFTQTNEGREHLRMMLSKPLSDIPSIIDVQQTIQQLQQVAKQWPSTITNGTIMVLERFYDTPVNSYPSNPSAVSSFFYKLVSGPDYSITKYSVEHFISFIKGMQQVVDLLHEPSSKQLQVAVGRIALLLKKPMVQEALKKNKHPNLTPAEILQYGNFMRFKFKHEIYEMVSIYSKLDAYLSLAHASTKYGFSFPQFRESLHPFVEAKELYHLLLNIPVSYNTTLNKEENFLFLTGANMAGKSTFIKAVGVSVYLAHLGMGVPAKSMQLSLFDGLLSNIQVADNIIKGESYFFNEVQRIKSTIEKISDGKKWLILIDELFKGTNVQDAMKCSTTVIEGLHKMNNALFILSTHLYEIGESLKQYPNIQFRYFETSVADEQLVFSYHLKEGISNDRLGYLILKKEGVVKMLEKL
jgi:DNA mismatch repair protein MutS